MLNREQFYLDILFSKYSDRKLNLFSGATLGVKHSMEFRLNRTGSLPMHGKTFSSEFIERRLGIRQE